VRGSVHRKARYNREGLKYQELFQDRQIHKFQGLGLTELGRFLCKRRGQTMDNKAMVAFIELKL
jgi:hypothetical protein